MAWKRRVGKADVLEIGRRLFAQPLLEEARDVFGHELDARDRTMRAHAQLAEALRHEEFLGAVDAREPLRRQRRAVREARGQAGKRRLIPGRQPERLGEHTDIGLAHTCLMQRAHDGELFERLVPRAVVAVIVEV